MRCSDPVAVEPDPPPARPWQPDAVGVVATVADVDDHDHVVAGPAVVPAVEGDHVVLVVDVVDVDVVAPQTTGAAVTIAAKVDEVAVEVQDALVGVFLAPVDRILVVEPGVLEDLLSLEEHRDARRGEHESGGERGALLRPDVPGVPWCDLLRKALLAVGDLVVRLGVDDPFEGVAVVAADDGVTERPHVAPPVGHRRHRLPDRVDEAAVPLGAEPGAADLHRCGQPGVVAEILGDVELPRLALHRLSGDALAQPPPIGHVMGRVVVVAVHVPDVGGGIPAQPVTAELLEPHPGVVGQEVRHLRAPVVGTGVAPRSLTAGVVVEVDAPFVVLGPAVEPPQVEVGRAEMVEDHIEKDGDAMGMGIPDQRLESPRSSIRLLDGEDVRRVVAPREVGAELCRRHQLNGVHPQVAQIAEPPLHAVEAARPTAGGIVERADMELVDHEVVPRRHLELRIAPVELRCAHDGIACRMGHRPGVGVVAPQHSVVGRDDEPVLDALLHPGDMDGPHPSALRRQRVRVGGPPVEAARHRHAGGERRPNPERHPLRIGDRTHP